MVYTQVISIKTIISMKQKILQVGVGVGVGVVIIGEEEAK